MTRFFGQSCDTLPDAVGVPGCFHDATDAEVALYADKYFEYDGSRRACSGRDARAATCSDDAACTSSEDAESIMGKLPRAPAISEQHWTKRLG